MNRFNIKSRTLIVLITLLVWHSSEQGTCTAREGKHWRRTKASEPSHATNVGDGQYSRHQVARLMGETEKDPTQEETATTTPIQTSSSSLVFNVLAFGAKGDGTTDDTQAFEAAWAAACKVAASTMVVPSGSVFLVKPLSFSGPNCESNIVFQMDGKIIAPTNPEIWGSGLLQWLEFSKLKGITVQGKGVIDGQGSVWWGNSATFSSIDESEVVDISGKQSNYSSSDDLITTESSGRMPNTKPTALRFFGCSGVTITGITIQNSQQTHLKFDDCQTVQVSDITVSSPGDSPNTDGIHLQNSQDVLIRSSNLACGDDCVSIQTGCSGVSITNVNCGPGHGISIGGLGKENTRACVSNITVRDSTIQNTMTGVRIKTWQGGSGFVQGITFSNIQVSEVKTAIMIDQFYCNGGRCQNETSAVAVSGVFYQNIKGTYTEAPVHFACSDSLPCTGVTLTTIELQPHKENYDLYEPFCWETYGELKTRTTPPIDCLKMSKSSSNQVHSNQDSC